MKVTKALDDWLLHLPRVFSIDETSTLNVNCCSQSTIKPEIFESLRQGSFFSLERPMDYPDPNIKLFLGLFYDQSAKMVTITLVDYMLNLTTFVEYDVSSSSQSPTNNCAKIC